MSLFVQFDNSIVRSYRSTKIYWKKNKKKLVACSELFDLSKNSDKKILFPSIPQQLDDTLHLYQLIYFYNDGVY